MSHRLQIDFTDPAQTAAFCVYQPGDMTRYEFILARLPHSSPGAFLVALRNARGGGKCMTFQYEEGPDEVFYVMEKMGFEGGEGSYDAGKVIEFLREAMPAFLSVAPGVGERPPAGHVFLGDNEDNTPMPLPRER